MIIFMIVWNSLSKQGWAGDWWLHSTVLVIKKPIPFLISYHSTVCGGSLNIPHENSTENDGELKRLLAMNFIGRLLLWVTAFNFMDIFVEDSIAIIDIVDYLQLYPGQWWPD